MSGSAASTTSTDCGVDGLDAIFSRTASSGSAARAASVAAGVDGFSAASRRTQISASATTAASIAGGAESTLAASSERDLPHAAANIRGGVSGPDMRPRQPAVPATAARTPPDRSSAATDRATGGGHPQKTTAAMRWLTRPPRAAAVALSAQRPLASNARSVDRIALPLTPTDPATWSIPATGAEL